MHSEDNKVNKSLKFSFWDGVFSAGMVGFTQEYFTPFLLLLGGTARHVGMLSALPNFFAALGQLKGPDISDKVRSRKKVINLFVFFQAIMLLPMILISLMGWTKPVIFISIAVLFTACGALANPPWSSLMSDLVAEDKRGEYFGWRNRVLGFIIVFSTFIAGFILHFMKKVNVFYGFVIIFSFAFMFRIVSWRFLKKMYEPPSEYHKDNYFTFIDFLSRIRESNFAKFVLFVAMMNFSVFLASPFFSVLMLKELRFSYMLYSIIIGAATLTIYLAIGRWGKHADRFGNLKIIKFTAPLIGIIPLFWIIGRHPLFLICAQIFSGFLWAGFNLCATNFIYDAVTPPKRTRCIAYFNVINGFALASGALIGGFLLNRLPELFGYKVLTLFLCSAILRILVGLFMPMKLKEVRPVEKISNNKLFFSMIGMRPFFRY